MKINLFKINRDQFLVNEHTIAGESVHLVVPKQKMAVDWSADNLYLRSSIWNDQGELISASFPKFFNYGEKPGLYPNPNLFSDRKATEKLDGSTLIVSKYKGEVIARTRGTVNASKLEKSGHEIELLKQKYPCAFDFGNDATSSFSRVFEWVTPANQIVIRYPEHDIILIAQIDHSDYSLVSQSALDSLAKTMGVKRPRIFNFNSLTEVVEAVSAFSDMEGVCLYYNNDQNIVKIKGDWYLRCHKLKSLLGSTDKVLDVYIELGREKSSIDVYNHIVETFDFELANQCKNIVEKIESSLKKISLKMKDIRFYVDSVLKPILIEKGSERGRAFCAKEIFSHDKENAPLYFLTLDGRTVDDDRLKKMVLADLKD